MNQMNEEGVMICKSGEKFWQKHVSDEFFNKGKGAIRHHSETIG